MYIKQRIQEYNNCTTMEDINTKFETANETEASIALHCITASPDES